MLTARLDYNLSENMKLFARFSYDNANEIGPSDSQSNFRNQLNVPGAVVGLDWNRGRFVHSSRFGYQKMVDAINPALKDSAAAPVHMPIGSYQLRPSVSGPPPQIHRAPLRPYGHSTM